ncbi:MAG: sigma-70 family RNA polymerase sigma factor [Candidatus Kapaibacteriales bacterium]
MDKKEKDRKRKQSNKEDFETLKEILSGNTDAFKKIEKKYRGIVSSLIRRMVKNDTDIEDLTQETFIKVFKALPNFQFEYSFSSWIYRIASNNTIDFLRKKRFNTFSIDQPIGNSDDDNYFEIEDTSFSADDFVLREEKRQILDQAISELSENYRKIIELRHKKELEYKEIAEILDIPLGTVKAHLFRARKMLYEALKNQKKMLTDKD